MNEWLSSVPLDDLLGHLEQFGAEVRSDPNGFTFRGRFNTTHLNVRPASYQAGDGSRVAAVITIRTDLPEFPNLHAGAERALSALNMNAALSAVLGMQDGQVTRLVSRLSAFEGDSEAWKLYAPMLSFAVVFQAEFFYQTVLRAHPDQHQVDGEVLPWANEPSRWDAEDFEFAQRLLDRIGVFANSGDTGLTAEFPWDTGAVTHIERFAGGPPKRTSLMTLTTTERHPALGNGLLCRLMLPVSYLEEKLAVAACRLNLLEADAVDAPPFFGAWCVDPETHSPTFVTFWPNVLHRSGVAANVTVWMRARSEIANRWTETDPVLRSLSRSGKVPNGARQ